MKRTFTELINDRSTVVDSIIRIMAHTKKEEARRFLTLMNTIIDYYLNKSIDDNKITYPIIYIPIAAPWAREVLLKFLILKLSLCYNNDLRRVLERQSKGIIYFNGEETKKERDFICGRVRYFKTALKEAHDDCIGQDGHKNIIFCNENDLSVSRADKNKFIREFYGNPDEVFTEKNLIMCHKLGAKDVSGQLREHRRKRQISIDNAFIFYTNNDKTKSLELTALEKWNEAYHVGLRNCFVIIFSNRPFSLHHMLGRRDALCKIFPMITGKDVYSYKHFIAFDQEETNLLFNKDSQQEHIYIEDDQLLFNDILGALIDEMDYKIQERNMFSLCMNYKLQDLYQQHLKSYFTDYYQDDYQISFDWQYDFSQKFVLPKIKTIIEEQRDNYNCNKLAIVIDKNVNQAMRSSLVKLLRTFNDRLEVSYYDYSALKGDKNNKANKIKETCVIVLQYRPHYVKEPYYKYPNSFDPFVAKEGQYIFDIIQGVAFNDMYQWDKYEYDKIKFDLLNCEFRNHNIIDSNTPHKPSVRRNTGESDFSDERSSSRSIKYIKGSYRDGSRFSIPETDLVLCDLNGSVSLVKISELIKNEQISQIQKLQTLDDIVNEFKSYVAIKTNETNDHERSIRNRYYTNGIISQEEMNSDISLWKLLLNKRIEHDGIESAYELVMNGLKDHEKVQIGQFKRWADYNDKMILPLQKICQRKLFDYLGFGLTSPYLSIMRSKKVMTKNGTRAFNSMMYKFLADTLLSDLNYDIYEEYVNSELNDLLSFNNYDEFELFVNILKNDIHLKPINITSNPQPDLQSRISMKY